MNRDIEEQLDLFRSYVDIDNFKYNASYFISDYFMIAIKDIFQNRCSVITVEDMDVIYGITFRAFILSNSNGIEIPQKFYETYSRLLDDCLTRGSKIVILPITLPNHKNMMIYFSNTNTFEYYEPHGGEYKGKKYEFLDVRIGIEKLVENLVKDGIVSKNAKVIFPEEICPLGLQRREKTIKGLCQIWSFFFVYFRLKFPETPFKVIEEYLFEVEDLDIIITGFANYLLERTRKITKDKSISFSGTNGKSNIKSRRNVSNQFVLDNIEKFESEVLSTLNKTCINIFNSTVSDVFEYLKRDKSNIVIKIGSNFYCYSLNEWINNNSEFIPIINDDKHYMTQETLNTIITLFNTDDSIRFFEFKLFDNKIYQLNNYINENEFLLIDF